MGLERGPLLAEHTLSGRIWCRAHSDLIDGWLSELFRHAAGTELPGLSLVAIGGYGRAELCPRSDIDVMLVHDRRVDVGGIAERLWYPVWEQELHLGHSVSTVRDALALGAADLDTATALLSARLVAGDPAPVAALADGALDRWRRRPRLVLSQLDERVEQRHEKAGEIAFRSEPDLKEGRGGLRDVHTLRWAEAAHPILLEEDEVVLDEAYATLLDARVALQRLTSRPTNVLAMEHQAGCGRLPRSVGRRRADGSDRRSRSSYRVDQRRHVATTVRPACACEIASISSRRSRAAYRWLRGQPHGRCRPAGPDVGAPRGGLSGSRRRRDRTALARTAGRGGVSLDRAVASRRPSAPGRALTCRRPGHPRDRIARSEGSLGPHPARMAVGAFTAAAGSASRLHRRPASAGDGGRCRGPGAAGLPAGPPARRGAPARHRQGIKRRSHRGRRCDRRERLSADGVPARRRRHGLRARRAPSAAPRRRIPPRRRRPDHRAPRGERGRVDRAAPLARGAHGGRRRGYRSDGVGSMDRAADRRARRSGRASTSRVEGSSRCGDHVPDAGPVGAA